MLLLLIDNGEQCPLLPLVPCVKFRGFGGRAPEFFNALVPN